MRLLVGAPSWSRSCVLLVLVLVAARPDPVDRVDHGFGEPFAAFTDRHPGVESTADRRRDVRPGSLPMAVYTLVVAVVLASGFRRTARLAVVVVLGRRR